MSIRATLARAGALLSVVAALTGCALGATPAPPTPTQVLQTRLAAFVAARSLILDGTVSLEGQTYQVTLNEDGASQAEGTVTLNKEPVVVNWSGGSLFLKSADYFQAQKLAVGTRWALTHGDKLQPIVQKLANRRELADALLHLAGTGVAQHSGPTTNAVATELLTSDSVTVTVPKSGGIPTRLATAIDEPMSDGLSDLKLTVAAPATGVTVTPPPSPYVDLANLNTLPANFEDAQGSDTFQFQNCDDGGCTLAEDFHNLGGRVGDATAMFFVVKQGTNSRLATCTVPIPATDHDGTTHAGCRVNFDGSLEVQGSVDILNPR
jgi:hypothetical protein